MEKAYEVLKETFGFNDFRLSQKEVVQRLLVDNENALVLFPRLNKTESHSPEKSKMI